MGKIKKALDWYFFSLVISAIMVRMMPTVPLMAPPKARQQAAWTKVVAKPYPKQLTAVPVKPTKSTNFLPAALESAAFPHTMAVATCAPVKQPCIIPACDEMATSDKVESKDLSW